MNVQRRNGAVYAIIIPTVRVGDLEIVNSLHKTVVVSLLSFLLVALGTLGDTPFPYVWGKINFPYINVRPK
jgi:hypothetical protein